MRSRISWSMVQGIPPIKLQSHGELGSESRSIQTPLAKKLNDSTIRFQEMALAVRALEILDERVLSGKREGDDYVINGTMFRDAIIGFVEGAKCFRDIIRLLEKQDPETWIMLKELRTSFAAHRFGKLRFCVSAARLEAGADGPVFAGVATLQANWNCPARPHVFANFMRPYVTLAEQTVNELGQELHVILQKVPVEDLLRLPLAEIPAISPYDDLMSGKERRRQKATSKGRG